MFGFPSKQEKRREDRRKSDRREPESAEQDPDFIAERTQSMKAKESFKCHKSQLENLLAEMTKQKRHRDVG